MERKISKWYERMLAKQKNRQKPARSNYKLLSMFDKDDRSDSFVVLLNLHGITCFPIPSNFRKHSFDTFTLFELHTVQNTLYHSRLHTNIFRSFFRRFCVSCWLLFVIIFDAVSILSFCAIQILPFVVEFFLHLCVVCINDCRHRWKYMRVHKLA